MTWTMRWTSRLWNFFFFKPAWYGRIHFFFCPVPSIIHVFCSWCFWKPKSIIEPLFTVYDRARQIIIQRLPNARQSSGLQIGSITVVWLEKTKKKKLRKVLLEFQIWGFMGHSEPYYLSLSLSPHLVPSPNFYFPVPRSFPQISHYPYLRRCKRFIQSRIYLLRVNASPQPIWEGVTCVQDRPLLGNLFHK